jgi:hypothetical protein
LVSRAWFNLNGTQFRAPRAAPTSCSWSAGGEKQVLIRVSTDAVYLFGLFFLEASNLFLGLQMMFGLTIIYVGLTFLL